MLQQAALWWPVAINGISQSDNDGSLCTIAGAGVSNVLSSGSCSSVTLDNMRDMNSLFPGSHKSFLWKLHQVW